MGNEHLGGADNYESEIFTASSATDPVNNGNSQNEFHKLVNNMNPQYKVEGCNDEGIDAYLYKDPENFKKNLEDLFNKILKIKIKVASIAMEEQEFHDQRTIRANEDIRDKKLAEDAQKLEDFEKNWEIENFTVKIANETCKTYKLEKFSDKIANETYETYSESFCLIVNGIKLKIATITIKVKTFKDQVNKSVSKIILLLPKSDLTKFFIELTKPMWCNFNDKIKNLPK
ncbi:10411_t:CDS:2, partial [Racocetra fulgida]